MVSDALDREIETKRREVQEARAQLQNLELELHTLELAAQLRPAGVAVKSVTLFSRDRPCGDSRRGGRQPGAISKEWREILKRVLAAYPDGALVEDIAAFGPAIGLNNLRPRDARQQAEKYVDLGYFERIGERYRVTDAAKARFGIGAVEPKPTINDSERSVAGEYSFGGIPTMQ